MLVAIVLSTVLVFMTVLVHYEILRYASILLPRLTVAPRQRILLTIGAVLIAHTIEIWLYACAYLLVIDYLGVGGFGGVHAGSFHDYLYFSTTTYTTLGYGDMYPLGSLRIVAGVESLIGLLMIAWSASFTYLSMERFWDMHARGKAGR